MLLFAKKLNDLLKERQMSRYKLAKLTGISQSALSRYIKGERQPKFENVEKIAQVLSVSVSFFSDNNAN